jgi:hypothetical protein
MAEAPVPSATGGGESATHAAGDAAGPHANINVQQLADKVYSLLLADARLSLVRGESSPRRTRKGEA